MTRPRVLLTHPLDAAAEGRLEQHCDLVRAEQATPQELQDLIHDCHAVVCRTHVRVDQDLLDAAKQLRVVGVAGVGLDRVDEAACAARGVRIVHTPDAASGAVAELALALMLRLLRPIHLLEAQYRDGEFRAARAHPHGDELGQMTVGLIGFGRIGQCLGRACAGLGSRVLFHDIVTVESPPAGCQPVEVDQLLAESDIVSLHTPLNEHTRGMCDADWLARCRPGARLINTARGAVVVTEALVEALRSGHLRGAGLDVTDPEPLPPDHPLFEISEVILTPHVAARTHNGLRRMFNVVDGVLVALAELPEIALDLPPANPQEEH